MVDHFVSLHLLEKPILVSKWSGHVDFLPEETY